MVDPSSGRATLLESIRQAGGIGKAKLRSVKERKLEKKKQMSRSKVSLDPLQEGALPMSPGAVQAAPACAGPSCPVVEPA